MSQKIFMSQAPHNQLPAVQNWLLEKDGLILVHLSIKHIQIGLQNIIYDIKIFQSFKKTAQKHFAQSHQVLMEKSFDRENGVDEKKAKLRKRNREAAQRSRLVKFRSA